MRTILKPQQRQLRLKSKFKTNRLDLRLFTLMELGLCKALEEKKLLCCVATLPFTVDTFELAHIHSVCNKRKRISQNGRDY
jgi:hypothetical protein